MGFKDKKIGSFFLKKKRLAIFFQVCKNEPDFISNISRTTDTVRDYTTYVLNMFIENNLVRREKIHPNNKNVFYSLTEKGKEVAEALKPLAKFI